MKYPFLDLAAVNAPMLAQIQDAAARVIASGRYIGGPETEAFEQRLAELAGTAFAVGVSNGLDALRLIFRAYIELGRLRPGDAVIVPANTYVASFLAVSDCGLRIVPVAPDSRSMNLSGDAVEAAAAANPSVKAVLTVHLYGRAAYDVAMADAVRRHGLILVEDNAQAIGAVCETASPADNHRTGGLGHAAAFSFYPTKNVGAAGDAGAVTTGDAELAACVRALANYGSDVRYHNIYRGLNCRLDPIQAAVLGVKLDNLERITTARRANAAVYAATISNAELTLPVHDSPDGDVWHQYVVRTSDRDGFRSYLATHGVGTDVHYPLPPHRQPCYAGAFEGTFPVADSLAATVVSLPISEATTPEQIREIAEIINSYHR